MESHTITSSDGTELCLWEDAPADAAEAVLFVHGATYATRPVFGIAGVDAEPSWFEAVSATGRAAYGVDLRGYGRSETPFPEPDGPTIDGYRAATVAADVASAYREIRDDFDAVHLVGFSWGTLVAGRFVTDYDPALASLTQLAPIYADASPDDADDGGGGDAGLDPDETHRTVTEADARDRWNDQIPDRPPAALRFGDATSDPVFDAFWRAVADSNQRHEAESTPTVAAPYGAVADVRRTAAGDPVYDASAIDVPTLVVRGSLDTTATRSHGLALVDAIGSTHPRTGYVEIGNATHKVLLERRRGLLFETVRAFQDDA